LHHALENLRPFGHDLHLRRDAAPHASSPLERNRLHVPETITTRAGGQVLLDLRSQHHRIHGGRQRIALKQGLVIRRDGLHLPAQGLPPHRGILGSNHDLVGSGFDVTRNSDRKRVLRGTQMTRCNAGIGDARQRCLLRHLGGAGAGE
jgi:hypothetical protein